MSMTPPDDELPDGIDSPRKGGFSVATNSLANQQCHAPILSKRIAKAESLEVLYIIQCSIQGLLAADKSGFLNSKSLTKQTIQKLLIQANTRAAELVHQNTSLGYSNSKDVPLDVLRHRNEKGGFTHASMGLLMMLLSQAKEKRYLPFLFQALKDSRFHRALRQPRGLKLQTNTWRTITEYCHPKPPVTTAGAK